MFRAIGLILTLFLSAPSTAANTEGFARGQLWECTTLHERASSNQRIQFLVSGTATMREVSRRPHFQNDKLVISVALADLNPDACPRASRFLHVAFTEQGLLECAPTLVAESQWLANPNAWKAATSARGNWLIRMQSNRGVVVGLTPSHFLVQLHRDRCE